MGFGCGLSPPPWTGWGLIPPPCLELELGASPEALVTTTVFKQFLCTCAGATLCVNCATCLIVQVVLWTWFPPGVPLSTPCPSCLLHPSPPPSAGSRVWAPGCRSSTASALGVGGLMLFPTHFCPFLTHSCSFFDSFLAIFLHPQK